MSGGGASNAISTIVAYQQDVHTLLLLGEDGAGGDDWAVLVNQDDDYRDNPSALRFILERGQTDAGGNPFDGVSAFDPSDELAVVDERVDEFTDAIAALDPDTDWDTFITKARAESATDVATLDVDALMEDVTAAARRTVGSAVAEAFERAAEADRDALVQKALDAFSKRQLKEHFKALSRFTAPMAQGGAINSSSYVVGVALMESEHEDKLATFDAEFTLPLTREAFQVFMNAYMQSAQLHLGELNRARLVEKQLQQQYLLDGTRIMMDALKVKTEFDRASVAIRMDANRQSIIANTEEDAQNLEYDASAAQWDMNLFQQGANILSAQQGSVIPGVDKPSKIASGLGGGLGGAALGASIGTSIAPGLGTAIGAGVGGVGGLLAGIF